MVQRHAAIDEETRSRWLSLCVHPNQAIVRAKSK